MSTWTTYASCAVCPSKAPAARGDDPDVLNVEADNLAIAAGYILIPLPHVTAKGHGEVWVCRPCALAIAAAKPTPMPQVSRR
jgi:hypothetical protein